MLSDATNFVTMAEVNPPPLPNSNHLMLDNAWSHVLVTDNVFGRIRVSPYAYSARITHDVPSVSPTVGVSTRDRNILAIESEVRGALGNGVRSFLVVVGDTLPHVEHLASRLEIVKHLRALQKELPDFEVGSPTSFNAAAKRRHTDDGAQFLVAGPILDPATAAEHIDRLDIQPDDPPVFVMVIPPFSTAWIDRMQGIGARSVTDGLRDRLDAATDPLARRELAWEASRQSTTAAEEAGARGTILMGLRFDTVIDEAALAWRTFAQGEEHRDHTAEQPVGRIDHHAS
jgi:5,10-methylenetetrahydrofolate reductase